MKQKSTKIRRNELQNVFYDTLSDVAWRMQCQDSIKVYLKSQGLVKLYLQKTN